MASTLDAAADYPRRVLVAAAVCPHPPLLVPEVAAGAAAESDGLRAACRDAVTRVLTADVEVVLVVGGGAALGPLPAWEVSGSLAPFGVDVRVGSADGVPLPLSLTIGCWLLERVSCTVPVEYVGVATNTRPSDAADLLTRLTQGGRRVGVLAMADLSAKLSENAPGYFDPRAADFDRSVVRALAEADGEALLRFDVDLAADLWCAGVPALAALAGALRTADGADVAAQVHYDAAPYGVGYVVVSWLVR